MFSPHWLLILYALVEILISVKVLCHPGAQMIFHIFLSETGANVR